MTESLSPTSTCIQGTQTGVCSVRWRSGVCYWTVLYHLTLLVAERLHPEDSDCVRILHWPDAEVCCPGLAVLALLLSRLPCFTTPVVSSTSRGSNGDLGCGSGRCTTQLPGQVKQSAIRSMSGTARIPLGASMMTLRLSRSTLICWPSW